MHLPGKPTTLAILIVLYTQGQDRDSSADWLQVKFLVPAFQWAHSPVFLAHVPGQSDLTLTFHLVRIFFWFQWKRKKNQKSNLTNAPVWLNCTQWGNILLASAGVPTHVHWSPLTLMTHGRSVGTVVTISICIHNLG